MWEKKKKRTTVCDKSTVTCDVDIAQSEDGTAKCEKKNGTIECDKSKVKCNVGTLMWQRNCQMWEKKLRELLNMSKIQLHVMLVLHNVRMV